MSRPRLAPSNPLSACKISIALVEPSGPLVLLVCGWLRHFWGDTGVCQVRQERTSFLDGRDCVLFPDRLGFPGFAVADVQVHIEVGCVQYYPAVQGAPLVW